MTAPPKVPVAAEDEATPTYAAPERSGCPRRFVNSRRRLWKVSQGDETLEVSLSRSGGSMEMKLHAGQAGGARSGSRGEPATDPITVEARPGTRVELKGAEKTIVGVIVPQGGASWFFKMMGPSRAGGAGAWAV